MQLEQITSLIDSRVSPEGLAANIEAIQAIDRHFTFPSFMESARLVAGKLSEWGLEGSVEEQAADGATRYGEWTMPMAWDCREAVLEIAGADGSPGETLCRRSDDPCCVAMWSSPTPPGGVTAELIGPVSLSRPGQSGAEPVLMLGDGGSARPVAQGELAGKVVYTPQDPRRIKMPLLAAKAAGIVSSFSPAAEYLPHNRAWVNGWSDDPDGWAFTAADTPMWCFMLTPAQGGELAVRLAAGPVTVRATVESRLYEGVLPAVTGILPGTGSGPGGEEILLLGHQFEIGADDNASGCAAMLEAARVLSALVREGALPRPARSLRWLFSAECYGSLAYALSDADRTRRTLAAINLDCVGADQRRAHSPLPVSLTPSANPSVADTLVGRLCSEYLRERDPFFSWHIAPFSPCDSTISDPMIGVPVVYLGGKGRFWHTSADTIDKIDPQAAARVAVIAASFAYSLASAGYGEALQLAEHAAADGRRRLVDLACGSAEDLRRARPEGMGAVLAVGLERLSHWRDVTAERVRSAQQFAEHSERREFRSDLRPLVAHVKKAARLEESHLRRVATRRARELDVSAPRPEPPARPPWWEAASRLIPVREVPGTITLESIPAAQRGGWKSPRWSSLVANVLFRCDGRRTLAEAVRLGLLDSGKAADASLSACDFLAFFQLLEKHGLVTLRASRRRVRPVGEAVPGG